MKVMELRQKSLSNLNLELLNLLREKFNLRMQMSSGKFKQFHLLRKVRKKIAQVKTIMTEKRIQNG